MNVDVKIIEKNKDRCEVLSEALPDATVIYGDGSDQELLKEERIQDMDSFVACTDMDEENIILSLYAKEKVSSKVVTKINHLEFNDVIHSLNPVSYTHLDVYKRQLLHAVWYWPLRICGDGAFWQGDRKKPVA